MDHIIEALQEIRRHLDKIAIEVEAEFLYDEAQELTDDALRLHSIVEQLKKLREKE